MSKTKCATAAKATTDHGDRADVFAETPDPRLKMVPMPLEPNLKHILASAEACGVPPELVISLYKCLIGLAASQLMPSRMLH